MVKQQQKTVYFIALIVVWTIGIQAYWNYIQYTNNRMLVINEIQNILDKVLNDYTKEHTQKSSIADGVITTEIEGYKTDSIQKIVNKVLNALRSNDQLNPDATDAPRISYNLMHSAINLAKFDKMLKQALKSKNYVLEYNLTITENGVVKDSFGAPLAHFSILAAKSQIAPLESTSTIHLNYSNPILLSLLKGLTGLVLSFFLCSIVIFALYYLLQIIKKQKQLSEVKNDFISNVTHEFKTPIAVVTSAIEAIKNFNNEQITDKTRRYLDISEQELKKLNQLVEKVMETSLLESSELNLDKQKTDLLKLLKACTEKHQLNTQKSILFESNLHHIELNIDAFHFENALSNLVDNAIKYGGNEIKVSVYKDGTRLIISVKDDGPGISKQDEPYIFDKFFRVKNQNMHRIKGFGIGLYYTKSIIEKHHGSIELINKNTFLITLWTT